jgi:hypothetical protein
VLLPVLISVMQVISSNLGCADKPEPNMIGCMPGMLLVPVLSVV